MRRSVIHRMTCVCALLLLAACGDSTTTPIGGGGPGAGVEPGPSGGDGLPDPGDMDGDGILDEIDNCPAAINPEQLDLDGDELGDTCDDDADGDGVLNVDDCDDLSDAVGAGDAWYADTDGDGLGDPDSMVVACEAPDNFVDNGDDTEPLCATNDTDVCGVCGGPGETTWFADTDGDLLGDAADTLDACEKPDGYVGNGDDLEPLCATNDTDTCGVCAGPGEVEWFADTDGDGLGDPATATTGCEGGEGFVTNGDDIEPDCPTNDTDSCGVCGGPGALTYYLDADEDGLGDPDTISIGCSGTPIGYVDNADDLEPDCQTNDSDECGVCAGPGAPMWYSDADGDGLGHDGVTVFACEQPADFVAEAGDPEPNCITNDTDDCGVCAGSNADMDCVGVCFGEAFVDGCERCVGGTSPIPVDEADFDGDGIPDVCDGCNNRSARTIIQWENTALYNAEGGPFTFQLILYENGDFDIVYEDMEPFEGVSATVGIQSAGGDEFALLGYDSEYAREAGHAYFVYDEETGIPELEYTYQRTWYDIRHVGTPLDLGDDVRDQVIMPHGFPFYGETYGEITVSSNGIVFFGSNGPSNDHDNVSLPQAGLPALIAPFWDDLFPTSAGGNVYFLNSPSGCFVDCDGLAGGVAIEDSCGVCIGGTTGVGSADTIDCNGECFGEAFIDGCGICSGGSTGIEPSDITDCPQAPDLVIDGPYMRERLYVDYIDADANPCYVNENCLGGPGLRKVIRFGTRIGNVGNEDLQLGVPPANGTSVFPWIWDECHGHHHYENYAEYNVYDADGEPAIDGAKNGFCVMDLGTYRPDLAQSSCNVYNCGDQGIGVGCQDTYWAGLSCQWVDVTDLPDGTYTIEVVTNPQQTIPELDYTNNANSVTVNMVGDTITLADSDD